MLYRRAKLEGTVLAEFRKFVCDRVADPKTLVDDVIVAGAWAFDQIRRSSWAGEASEVTQRSIDGTLEWLNRVDNVDWVPAAIRIIQSTSDGAKVAALLGALERLAASSVDT